MAAGRVNIDDPKNYKSCRKKQYEIWMCMPPAGTVVINKLEQPDIVKKMGGNVRFAAETLEKTKQSNPPFYAALQQLVQAGLVYCTKPGDVVLSGTRGELWVTSAAKVMKTYQVFLNGQWGSNFEAATKSRGTSVNGQFCVPWMKIRAMGDNAAATMACFVPSSQKGQIRTSWAVLNYNAAGVDHGLGDFVVCAKLPNGQPNLADRWVVNGAVFADTYNNQGWQECLKMASVDMSALEPGPLFSSAVDTSVLDKFIRFGSDILRKQGYEAAITSAKDSVAKIKVFFADGQKSTELSFIWHPNEKAVEYLGKRDSMSVRQAVSIDSNDDTAIRRAANEALYICCKALDLPPHESNHDKAGGELFPGYAAVGFSNGSIEYLGRSGYTVIKSYMTPVNDDDIVYELIIGWDTVERSQQRMEFKFVKGDNCVTMKGRAQRGSLKVSDSVNIKRTDTESMNKLSEEVLSKYISELKLPKPDTEDALAAQMVSLSNEMLSAFSEYCFDTYQGSTKVIKDGRMSSVEVMTPAGNVLFEYRLTKKLPASGSWNGTMEVSWRVASKNLGGQKKLVSAEETSKAVVRDFIAKMDLPKGGNAEMVADAKALCDGIIAKLQSLGYVVNTDPESKTYMSVSYDVEFKGISGIRLTHRCVYRSGNRIVEHGGSYNGKSYRSDGSDVIMHYSSSDKLANDVNKIVSRWEHRLELPSFSDPLLKRLDEFGASLDVAFKSGVKSAGYVMRNSDQPKRTADEKAMLLRYHITGDNDESLLIAMRMESVEGDRIDVSFRGKSEGVEVRGTHSVEDNGSDFSEGLWRLCADEVFEDFEKQLKLSPTRRFDQLMELLKGCSSLRYHVDRRFSRYADNSNGIIQMYDIIGDDGDCDFNHETECKLRLSRVDDNHFLVEARCVDGSSFSWNYDCKMNLHTACKQLGDLLADNIPVLAKYVRK